MTDPKELLKQAKANIQKEAFNPMTPEAQASAAGGGAPPMDPAMMGGAPPMDPAMMGGGGMPMDPAMMGGAPPMDPAMAGGMPPMDPAMAGMDPAMMGGMPPEGDPAAGTPVTLNLEDLKLVMDELQAGGGEAPGEAPAEGGKVTNKELMAEVASLKETVQALAAAAGVQLPAGDVGMGGDTGMGGPAAAPEDIAAVAGEMESMGMDPMGAAMEGGLPPGEFPEEAMPKMAVDQWFNTKVGNK